jgi:hypothetical protein
MSRMNSLVELINTQGTENWVNRCKAAFAGLYSGQGGRYPDRAQKAATPRVPEIKADAGVPFGFSDGGSCGAVGRRRKSEAFTPENFGAVVGPFSLFIRGHYPQPAFAVAPAVAVRYGSPHQPILLWHLPRDALRRATVVPSRASKVLVPKVPTDR